MVKTSYVLGALLLIAGSHASAQAPIYTGGGTVKCSQLVQDYDRNKQTEIVYWTWAQGYMSGINRVLDQSKAGTRDLTNAGTQANKASLISFCRQNPNSFFIDAVDKLFMGLPTTSQ